MIMPIEGPLGNIELSAPFSAVHNLGLVFHITGRAYENESGVYSDIRDDIILNLPIRAEDVYVVPSYDSNFLSIGIQMSENRSNLYHLNNSVDVIKSYIKNNENIGTVDYTYVVCGNVEEETANNA